MYSFEEICELIRLVGSNEVSSVEIEEGEYRIRIEGRQVPPQPLAIPAAGVPMAGVQAAGIPTTGVPAAGVQVAHFTKPSVLLTEKDAASEPEEVDEQSRHLVTSPIVGTFYRAPNPDASPYVKVGDFVEKGQVLCIVEAMKLMNEIESDASGTIEKIYPKNAEPVEFGQQLFALRLA